LDTEIRVPTPLILLFLATESWRKFTLSIENRVIHSYAVLKTVHFEVTMSTEVNRLNRFWVHLIVALSCVSVPAQSGFSPEVSQEAIARVMTRVADWQLANPGRHTTTDWTQGAFYTGMSAWAHMADTETYTQTLKAIGEQNKWQLGQRPYLADDHCVGQMYLDLFKQVRNPVMIQPLQERFDWILAHPSASSLKVEEKTREDRWWWCDALFMGPPVWAELAAVTGDLKYLDFMNKEWWATTDFLYDKEEHLYFRDSRYFNKREPNGNKKFWCRGNGWVFGGLVKVLQALPLDYPDRPRYLKLYRDMAATLLEIQGQDGLWRSSLLDPVTYPSPEASGSGFFCYGLAWGVNRGLLDGATYLPAVKKAWQGLVGCVQANGMLGWVQPIGAAPGKVGSDMTEVYGVGAFLLAGTEVIKIALREDTSAILIHTVNDITLFRARETLSVSWPDLAGVTASNVVVVDFLTNQPLVSQVLDLDGNQRPEALLFQADFSPNQQRWFWVMNATGDVTPRRPETTIFGRFVPERMDDFAWENDRIAYRMYGKALEIETVSSGIDVWVKKVTYPVVDKWYAAAQYHTDQGEGLDYYKVGPTRGCGGLSVYKDGALYGSRNFVNSRVLANGPIRTMFELDYEPWDAAGQTVSETKRISLDLGSNLNRVEDVFKAERSVPVAVGIVLRGQDGLVTYRPGSGPVAYWEPQDPVNGIVGCGIVMPGSTPVKGIVDSESHVLVTGQAEPGKPFVYYTGACWNRSTQFEGHAQWMQYLTEFSQCLDHPIVVKTKKQ